MNKLNIIKTSPKPIPRGGATFLPYSKGKYILIGGANRTEELNDIWTLHLTYTANTPMVGIWNKTQLKNQELYTPRSGQSAFIDKDGMIYLFGGQIFSTGQQTDEFFRIDTNQQIIQYAESTSKPSARNSSALAYDSVNNLAYMVGGANQNGPLDDLQIFDIENKKWKEQQINGYHMKPREMHSIHIIKGNFKLTREQSQETRIVHNDNKSQVIELNFNLEKEAINEQIAKINLIDQQDLNELNQEVIEESKENILQNQELMESNSENHDRYLMIIGGRCFNEVLNEILVIDLQKFNCSLLKSLDTPLCAHSSLSIDHLNTIIILGGFNEQGFSSDLFVLKTDQEELSIEKKSLSVCSEVVCRIAISIAFSIEHQKVIIFGGSSIEDESNDVYIVDTQLFE